MMRSRAWTVTTAAVTTLLAAGCQPKPRPAPPPPPPPPALTVPQQRAADVNGYRDALARFDTPLADLPGHTQEDHRRLSAEALAALTDALRLAYGTNPPPEFTSDVSVVAAAAATVDVISVPRSRMEAAENQALHAAAVAAGEIAMRVLYDDPGLPPLVSAAAERADAAHVTQGPLHDGDATDALRTLDVVLHRIGDDLHDRFTPAAPAFPAPMYAPPAMMMPTTMPSTMPDAAAAPMPATAPSTMP